MEAAAEAGVILTEKGSDFEQQPVPPVSPDPYATEEPVEPCFEEKSAGLQMEMNADIKNDSDERLSEATVGYVHPPCGELPVPGPSFLAEGAGEATGSPGEETVFGESAGEHEEASVEVVETPVDSTTPTEIEEEVEQEVIPPKPMPQQCIKTPPGHSGPKTVKSFAKAKPKAKLSAPKAKPSAKPKAKAKGQKRSSPKKKATAAKKEKSCGSRKKDKKVQKKTKGKDSVELKIHAASELNRTTKDDFQPT